MLRLVLNTRFAYVTEIRDQSISQEVSISIFTSFKKGAATVFKKGGAGKKDTLKNSKRAFILRYISKRHKFRKNYEKG